MKKLWATITIVAVAVLAVVLILTQTRGKPSEIKIGAILPLTGPSAQYGKWIQEALELAKEEVNSSGGINGKRLEIVYEDDQANPSLAANAMRKVVNQDKVPVVFGSWASSCALAQAPIAEQTHTVMMAEAISPKLRDAGDYVFRIQPDARYYIREFVPFVYNKLGIRKVSILYVNNDFGLDQADVFTKQFEALGGSVVSKDSFEQGTTDFKTDLTKIKGQKPEAIFCPAYTEIAIVLKQARELGMKEQFLASVPFENPDILTAAGNAAEGVVYPHHFDPDAGPQLVKDYQQKYIEKYGRKSEGFAALAYDGIRILIEVLKKRGSDTTSIKDALYEVRDFPGVTGPTTFDDHGDVIKRVVIKTVRNGRFLRY
jgi:branched-chain amino acid transport system substrate-binding protein